jgi:glutamine synthetase
LTEALDELEANENLREHLAGQLVDAFLVMKRDEIARYDTEVGPLHGRTVTQWEIDEYMEDF